MLTLVNDECSESWPKEWRKIDEPGNRVRIKLEKVKKKPGQTVPSPIVYVASWSATDCVSDATSDSDETESISN